MAIVVLALFFSTVFTLIVLQGYEVNLRNFHVFTRLAKMRRNGCDGEGTGAEIYNYVVRNLNGERKGRVDITFAQVLTEDMLDEAITVVIRKLLDNGYKPVSLSRKDEKVEIIVG